LVGCAKNSLVFRATTLAISGSSTSYQSLNTVTGVVTDITSSILAALPSAASASNTNNGYGVFVSPQSGAVFASYTSSGGTNTSELAKSSDGGITWTALANFPVTAQNFVVTSNAFAPNILLAQLSSLTGPVFSLSLDDGVTWTTSNLGSVLSTSSGTPNFFKTSNGYVAIYGVLGTATNSAANVATSTDGLNWTAQTTTSLSASNFYYVNTALGSVGNALLLNTSTLANVAVDIVSTDSGNTWTAVTLPNSITPSSTGMYIVNGQFVLTANSSAAPYNEMVYTSPDAVNWTALTSSHPLPTTIANAGGCSANATSVVSNATGSIAFIFNNPSTCYR